MLYSINCHQISIKIPSLLRKHERFLKLQAFMMFIKTSPISSVPYPDSTLNKYLNVDYWILNICKELEKTWLRKDKNYLFSHQTKIQFCQSQNTRSQICMR